MHYNSSSATGKGCYFDLILRKFRPNVSIEKILVEIQIVTDPPQFRDGRLWLWYSVEIFVRNFERITVGRKKFRPTFWRNHSSQNTFATKLHWKNFGCEKIPTDASGHKSYLWPIMTGQSESKSTFYFFSSRSVLSGSVTKSATICNGLSFDRNFRLQKWIKFIAKGFAAQTN